MAPAEMLKGCSEFSTSSIKYTLHIIDPSYLSSANLLQTLLLAERQRLVLQGQGSILGEMDDQDPDDDE